MRLKINFILVAAFSLTFIGSSLIFSRAESLIRIEEKEPVGAQTEVIPVQPEVQWVWGEVLFVDTNTKQMGVKYLDYETDTEKEMTLNVDEKAIYENAKSLEEIKPLDSVSIDYIIDAKGNNIATNISAWNASEQQATPEENTQAEPKLESF